MKRIAQTALLLTPFFSWGFAQVACSTTFAGGLVSPFTIYAINTTTGAAQATSTTTPRFNTLFSTNGTNTTAATVAFARDPITNRLYYIENTTTATSRIGYYDFATGTTVAAGTITKATADAAGNFTRFGFNAQGVGYASISSTNAVYTIVPATANTVTVTRVGVISGLATGLSGDFAITAANRAWLSANGIVYRIELSTLVATQIVNTGSTAANGVAFDANGDLLVSSSTDVSRVDLGTLTVSSVGPINGPVTSGDLANCVIPTLTPNLSVVKAVSPAGSVAPGTVLTYTITVSNLGNAASINTTFQDSIPTNTTYVANSTTLNGAALADAAGSVMPFATASPIKSPSTSFGSGIVGTGTTNQATITFQVRVNNPFPSVTNSVSNQGIVEYDSGTGNTRTAVPTAPTAGGSGATFTTITGRDFGDAPDGAAGTGVGNYQTTGSDNGPSHTLVSGLRLGSVAPDADSGTLQNAAATADNLTGTNDEEGVSSFPAISTVAAQAVTVPVTVINTTGATASLVGYLDFNKDGDFLDAGEQSALVPVAVNQTAANVIFTTPTGLSAGTTYARFRIGGVASEVASSVGAASSGEVEDYLLTIGSPDLTISKTHTPATFVRGSTGTYTLTVSNSGNQPTSSTMTVTDTLPAGLSVNGGAAGTVTTGGTNAANWTCTSNGASPQTITCTSTAVVATGGSSVFTLSVNVATNAGTPVVNTVAVSGGGEAAVNSDNNTSSDSAVTVSPTDLTLAKSHSGDFTVGSVGTYTFTVNNIGGVASSGTITVTDTLPTGLSFVTGSATGTDWTCSASGQTVTCTRSTAVAVAGNSSFSFNVNVGVATAPGTNSVTNTAVVSGGGDSNTANNGASDPTTILSPDLTVTKTHTPSNFVQGGTGTYTVTVRNSGAAPTSGTVTVTDTLPTGLTFITGSASGTGWSCSASGQVVTCTRTGTVATGSTSTFNFGVNVASSAPASVTNNVSVTGGNEATANAGNNTFADPTPTVNPGSLTLVKSVRNVTQNSAASITVGSGEPGDVLEYCVAYSNTGQSPVTNTVVNDAIPVTTTPFTSVSDYSNQAVRWRTTVPSASTQNLTAPSGDDAGELGAVLTVRVGAVPAGGKGDICFRAQIN